MVEIRDPEDIDHALGEILQGPVVAAPQSVLTNVQQHAKVLMVFSFFLSYTYHHHNRFQLSHLSVMGRFALAYWPRTTSRYESWTEKIHCHLGVEHKTSPLRWR